MYDSMHAETFRGFAEEFELLAIALGDSDDPERRKVLLRRMRAIINEIDALINFGSGDDLVIRTDSRHDLEKLLEMANKVQASMTARPAKKLRARAAAQDGT
jgi:hypothetical protein